MLQRIMPAVATVCGICAFISITMYSIYLNAVPQYTIECTGCGSCLPGGACPCSATEDFCTWGMVQKCSSVMLLAYMALYVLLCYAIAIIVERWLTYYYAERQTREFIARMSDAIYGNRIDEANNLAAVYLKSPLAAVINASLNPTGACATSGDRPSMEAWHTAMVVKTTELKRGLWNLSAAGWTVPLIGVFILVIGLINTLQGVKYAEGRYSPCIASSLADALWATVFSLLAGIPVIWFHKHFAARLEIMLTEMERRSLAILSLIANPPKALVVCGAIQQYDTQPLDIRVTERLRN